MRTLSLFAGGGLLDYGLHRAGFQHVGFVESDPFARRVLARHWLGVPILEDVRHLDRETIRIFGEVDAIVAGPPCQPVSYDGAAAGRLPAVVEVAAYRPSRDRIGPGRGARISSRWDVAEI